MLEFRNVSFTYKNSEEKVLNNVSFKINEGECVLLTGVSGSGKSTIVHLMNGLIPALYEGELTGKIYYNNTSLESIKTYDIAKDIGYVSQDPRGHFFTTNTTSELVFAMENFGISLDEMKKRYSAVVELLELEEIVDKNILYISSGERQKIAIGCSLTLIPRVIILDEPFSGLDPVNAQSLKNIIKENIAKDKIVIFSSHQMSQVEEFCQDIVFIKAGRIIKNCSLEELKSEYSGNKYIINTTDNDKLKKILEKNKISYYEEKEIIIENSNLLDIEKLILKNDIVIEKIAKYQKTLEEIFVEIEGDNNE